MFPHLIPFPVSLPLALFTELFCPKVEQNKMPTARFLSLAEAEMPFCSHLQQYAVSG